MIVGAVTGSIDTAGASGSDSSTTAVSYNGVALTELTSIKYFTGANSHLLAEVSLWYLLNPATGTHTVSVSGTFAYTSTSDILAGALTVTGNDPTTPLGTPQTAKFDSGAGTSSISVTFSSTTSGNLLVDVSANGTGGESSVSGTISWRKDVSTHSGSDNAAGSTKASPGGSTTMSYSIAGSDYWGLAAVEILSAPGAAPVAISEAPMQNTPGRIVLLGPVRQALPW